MSSTHCFLRTENHSKMLNLISHTCPFRGNDFIFKNSLIQTNDRLITIKYYFITEDLENLILKYLNVVTQPTVVSYVNQSP